ncbi:MAG: sigma-70 family RNA polymerase sigma factor [Candidatus Thiodiazotropha sp. (ex Monitilora ramsayi)]|nr:sigma-70 family RNA polymerase sigma factor [Candidatus Thiodiazotropha sp. (ex Monitilora ramsayi)]
MESHMDPDLALFERVVQQDKAAFRALYRKFYQPLFHFLIRMLQRQDIVEEVVDDVMLTVWNKAGDFRGRSKVSTWIIGIAYRKGLKSYNKNRREPGMDDLAQHAGRIPGAADQSPDHSLEQQQLAEQVQSGLETLNGNHRCVMELTMLGYSCAEIADIVGCPVNTVKTRMFHARRQLKDHFGQSESLNPQAGGEV